MLQVSTVKTSPVSETFYLPLAPSPRSLKKDRSSPSLAGESDAFEHERLVKSLLKQFKRLEFTLSKFNAKLNGIVKTNMLRTTLLPFLRLLLPLDSLFANTSQIYSSFESVSIAILGRWWCLLLEALTASNPMQQVSLTDRNAYLECISRIFCRKEWFLAGPEAMETYSDYLSETLSYAINKLSSMKIVPLSMSAFVGKTFAYAFFFIPGVSNALLFLLNVKQSTVESSLTRNGKVSFDTINAARLVFPVHLKAFIGYKGLQNLDRVKKKSINCVPPPKHPVRGISEPKGLWVRSWSCCDSDVFNSFFRHYVSVASFFVDDRNDIPLQVFPGFHIIMGNVHQIFCVCINKILLETTASGSYKKFSVTKTASAINGPVFIGSSVVSRPLDANYAPLIKLFKTIRDVGYSNVSFSAELVKSVDNVMINLATVTSIHEFGRSASIFNLVCEYSNYVADSSHIDWEFWLGCSFLTLSKSNLIQSITMSFAFIFNVWSVIPSQLPKEVDPRTQSHLSGWLTNPNESYKQNFARWLTSNDIWEQYFTHWNPLVRSHYMRLISWRVIGFNNYNSSGAILTIQRIKTKVDVMYSFLLLIFGLTDLPLRLQCLDFSADLPMVNRKLSIVPVNSLRCEEVPSLASVTSTAKLSDLRKAHPYEVLDESVYTCHLLSNAALVGPSKERSGKSSRNHSLVNSFSKFFKFLYNNDTDGSLLAVASPSMGNDSAEGDSITIGRELKSFNSFLTGILSLRSGSSCTGLTSKQQSNCDTLTDSPVTSDSESSSTLSSYLGSSSASTRSSDSASNNNPPEFIKHTPDIIRPVYKFDVILDHDLISRKVDLMQSANAKLPPKFYGSNGRVASSLRAMPEAPRIPATSIVVSADRLCRFCASRERLDFGEDALPQNKMPKNEDVFRNIRTPTALAALGRSLNEWNMIVDEFESFLALTVNVDQIDTVPFETMDDFTPDSYEEAFFRKIVPFMPIDNFIELKLLNAL